MLLVVCVDHNVLQYIRCSYACRLRKKRENLFKAATRNFNFIVLILEAPADESGNISTVNKIKLSKEKSPLASF